MVFSSMTFIWVFLPILFIVYFLVKEKYANYVLLVFSLLFYAWGEPKYIVLMLLSILVNYIIGIMLGKYENKKVRISFLILAIIFNLGLIGYFKYFNFFVLNFNRLFGAGTLDVKNIVLPIGISFYTFQILSYVIDVYRKDIKPQKNILSLALYISFFPQLVAGPIVKYHDIEKQLSKREVNINKFSYGIKRFVYGLGKKVILANSLAFIADMIFDASIDTVSTGVAWIGSLCYTLQIYFDFSGYSDMAIGLGKMFGFDFMENFNFPYISSSITEFWRRWHISLSTWFKEYLYIPLGGNRKGKNRTYFNLWMVFLATGIWHGASWNFVFWGLFHGFFIFIERLGLKKWLDKYKVIGHIYTLFLVNLGWVFFRASGIKAGLRYIKVMFGFKMDGSLNLLSVINIKTVLIILISILLTGIIQSIIKRVDTSNKLSKTYRYVEPVVILFILVVSIILLVSSTYNPFIYFRF